MSTRPKVRRNNWKYQSGLLPKFQRAVAQGARELSCIHVRGPGCSPMADSWHCMLWHVTAKAAAHLRAPASLLTAHAHNSVNHRVRWLAADAQLPLRNECMADFECILSCACVARQVRCLNWKYQSGILPESHQACASHACGSTLHRPVAACARRVFYVLRDEQTDQFHLENDVLQRKMDQSGASAAGPL